MTSKDLEPLSARALDLLEAERPIPALEPKLKTSLRGRVWQSIGISGPIGGGDGGSGGAPAHPASSAQAPASPAASTAAEVAGQSIAPAVHTALGAKALVTMFVIGAALGGVTAGGAVTVLDRTTVQASAPVVMPRVVLLIPVASADPQTTASAPAPPIPSASVAKTAPLPATSNSIGHDTDLGAERALLSTARTAVGRGDGASALASLRQHQQQFPQGRLSEERESLRVQALMLAGDQEAAKQQAESFKRHYPQSVHARAVDKALGK